MNVQNMNAGSGGQNNYNAPEQNINYGGDQLVAVNVGRDFVRNFTTTTSNPHKSLWDAVAGVGASHKAEQQFARGECLEGTRKEALQMIHDWMKAKEQVLPICWLSGAAGVGKTAIAMTIAKYYEEDGLVSSFFLFRSDPRRNNPSALMLAIAHGITITIPSLHKLVNQRISRDPRILEARIEEQFGELVLKPSLNWGWRRRMRALLADFSLTTKEPTLVIIDGLDECNNVAIQLRILAAIADSYQRPTRSPLRFLICSRSESWIRQAFSARPLHDITQSIVLDNTFSPANDIERYLVHELEGIRENPEYTYIEFPAPWPSREDLDCLTRRSDGQFVYVVTAVKFVKIPHCNPVKQLRVIIANPPVESLTKSPYPELDNLYRVILTANPDHDMVLIILAAILLLPHEEMDDEGRTQSPEWLGLLLGLSSGEVILALRGMHSVLDIRGPTDRIRVYHTSFTDYLSDQTRSAEFCIAEQKYVLAQRWLQALSRDRIGWYSPAQLYGRLTILFFTSWIIYCISLPEPTPALLDDLRNLDLSALFFCILVLRSRMGSFRPPTWDEAFEAMVAWLLSSVNSTAGHLIKRFREQPKVFHVETEIDPADIVWNIDSSGSWTILSAVHFITGYQSDRIRISKWSLPTFHVTGCYCHDINVIPNTTSPSHPGHRLYQSACLQVLREVVGSINKRLQVGHHFLLPQHYLEYLLDSSLLLHCPFKPALFSLCGTIIKLTRTYRQPDEVSRNTRKYERKLLKWLA
ncbi:hypothetical protein V5O48_017747, partial [Marasmius crinis-equi]